MMDVVRPTGTLTFVFSDVEGSTALWDNDLNMRAAAERLDAIIASVAQQFNGFLVRERGEGDSHFVVFQRAIDAVAASVTMQRVLYAEPWSTTKPLRVRIAIHTGEADWRAGDYYGSEVNRCARIRALGHGGQILLSQVSYFLVRDQLRHAGLADVHVQDMGEVRLKGLTLPERIFQLVPADLPAMFPPLKVPPTTDQNRSKLLAKVRHAWVEGVLKNAVGSMTLLTPGLELQPELIEGPWSGSRDESLQQPHLLPNNTTVVEVFDQVDGELLILGEPGAGKTTLLLELTEALLKRAEIDEAKPIPVVFTLGSWTKHRLSLGVWLVDELNVRYHVRKDIGQAWLDTGMLLPLLDGLDEVPAEHRTRCIAAINAFRQYHGLAMLVVCCRTDAYVALKARLTVQGAIHIQRLTDEQVDTYLLAGGKQGAALSTRLRQDSQLWQMAHVPLMLNIMTLTYARSDNPLMPRSRSVEELRQHILDAYVTRMFQRHTARKFPQRRTTKWLAWLACMMQQHRQNPFYLERIQPNWLPNSQLRMYYLLVALVLGLFVGLIVSPIAQLNFGLLLGVTTTFILLMAGENQITQTTLWAMQKRCIFGLLLGMCVLVSMWVLINQGLDTLTTLYIVGIPGMLASICFIVLHRVSSRWGEVVQASVSFGVSVGSAVGLLIPMLVGNAPLSEGDAPLSVVIPVSLLFGLVAGSVSGILAGVLILVGRKISVVERLHWSWRRFIVVAFIATLCFGLVISVATSWELGLFWGLRMGIASGVIVGLTGGEMEKRDTPNQGIHRSALSFFSGILVGIVIWFVFHVLSPSTEPEATTAQAALRGGMVVGLIWVLRSGFVACCQHVVLRVLLHHNGSMPYRYVQFLNEAADHLFLRRVGGGYIFVHQLLQEFFAAHVTNSSDGSRSKD